jgi:quercetin dioxygenase-like cupin family protein
MRTASILIGASLLLPCTAPAQEPREQAAPTSKASAREPVVMPASDLDWKDLDPTGAPGVKIAPLWGDYTKGAYGVFLKLPAGFTVPLHTHSHDMRVIFVSGTYIQKPDGKPEFRLAPGSYFMQPGGNYRHVTSCDAASDCVFFVESDGAFDLRVVQP